MQTIRSISRSAVVMLVAFSLAFSLPALALEGSDASGSEDKPVQSSSLPPKPEDRAHHEQAALRQKAQAESAKKREEHKDKTHEQRQKFCVAHKQGLSNKFKHIVTNAQRTDTRISAILARAIDYQLSHNLTVDNFDSLVASAKSAQIASGDSIVALQAITPKVDCNSESVASDVGAFKTAAATTRDNLKAYKQSVKAVLKALRDAKQASTEGSEQ